MKWWRAKKPHSFDAAEYSGLAQSDTEARMHALERLLSDWLGPRQDSFGEPLFTLEQAALPAVLLSFYRFAGRWPSPHQERSPVIYESPEEAYFYTGISSTHMAPLTSLQQQDADTIELFFEQSGNWVGITQTAGVDPPVWYREGTTIRNLTKSGESLSGWIVAHVLAAIAWESENNFLGATGGDTFSSYATVTGSGGLCSWFGSNTQEAALLVSSKAGPPELSGSFYLFCGSILVHSMSSTLRFAALSPEAATEIRKHAAPGDILD